MPGFIPTLVEPEVVCARLGVVEPTEAQLDRARDSILDAQADLELAIERPLYPRIVTVEGLVAAGPDLNDWRAWRAHGAGFDDEYRVVGVSETSPGIHTVTFSVGIDGVNENPIHRWIIAAAVESLRDDPSAGFGEVRRVKSQAADGQSVTYESAPAAGAGAAPSLAALKRRYRLPAVFRADRANVGVWPYADRW